MNRIWNLLVASGRGARSRLFPNTVEVEISEHPDLYEIPRGKNKEQSHKSIACLKFVEFRAGRNRLALRPGPNAHLLDYRTSVSTNFRCDCTDRRDSGRRLCYDSVFGHGATLCFYRPYRPAGGRPRQAAQKMSGTCSIALSHRLPAVTRACGRGARPPAAARPVRRRAPRRKGRPDRPPPGHCSGLLPDIANGPVLRLR